MKNGTGKNLKITSGTGTASTMKKTNTADTPFLMSCLHLKTSWATSLPNLTSSILQAKKLIVIWSDVLLRLTSTALQVSQAKFAVTQITSGGTKLSGMKMGFWAIKLSAQSLTLNSSQQFQMKLNFGTNMNLELIVQLNILISHNVVKSSITLSIQIPKLVLKLANWNVKWNLYSMARFSSNLMLLWMWSEMERTYSLVLWLYWGILFWLHLLILWLLVLRNIDSRARDLGRNYWSLLLWNIFCTWRLLSRIWCKWIREKGSWHNMWFLIQLRSRRNWNYWRNL